MTDKRSMPAFLLAVCMGLSGLTSLPASAQTDTCLRLCDHKFMRTATAAQIWAEIVSGANIHTTNQIGATPLHRAAGLGNAEATTTLI